MNTWDYQTVSSSIATPKSVRNRHKASVLYVVIFGALCASVTTWASVEIHTVPADIRASFSGNKCEEIFDYYRDSKVTEKPYIYGALARAAGKSSTQDFSFIAWCKTTRKDVERPYVLVANLGGKVWPGGCKFPVVGFDYPGGISIIRKSVRLDSFDRLEGGKKVSGAAFGPLVESEKDGLRYELFCFKGEWLRSNSD